MKMPKQKGLVPPLRFPEFRDAGPWELKRLVDIACFAGGGTPSKSNPEFWKGSIPWVSSSDIDEEFIQHIKISKFINQDAIYQSATKIIPPKSILLVSRVGAGKLAITNQEICTSQDFINITPIHNIDVLFLGYYLKTNSRVFKRLTQGMAIKGFTKEDIQSLRIYLPKKQEQQKIADCLSSLDDLIQAEEKALEVLNKHKKGLMQQLFPAPGETTPKLRFPKFRDAGPWELKELGDALDYQQPGPFIVLSEQYKKNGIPVLTAGKTFILGYTSEDFGIYENVPVIIFDDFTTESKFVDFPFKVKSSAIKILTARPGYSIKFVYEAMSLIKFSATQHKRYWISEYQHLKIPFPKVEEQQKIADCLSSLDELILAKSKRIDALKLHKKGLMQQLFVSV